MKYEGTVTSDFALVRFPCAEALNWGLARLSYGFINEANKSVCLWKRKVLFETMIQSLETSFRAS